MKMRCALWMRELGAGGSYPYENEIARSIAYSEISIALNQSARQASIQ
jgi:hypothetical protein